jgi:hypothetical protein
MTPTCQSFTRTGLVLPLRNVVNQYRHAMSSYTVRCIPDDHSCMILTLTDSHHARLLHSLRDWKLSRHWTRHKRAQRKEDIAFPMTFIYGVH